MERITEHTHQVFLKVIDLTNKLYTNQTSRFPVTSSRGFKYIMTAYVYDSNNILVEPIKSRTGFAIKTAYQKYCNFYPSGASNLKYAFLKTNAHSFSKTTWTMITTYSN